MLSEYWPSISSTLLLYTGFKVAQWENQRWVRARSGGLRGSNEGFGLFVDLTGFAAMIFSYVWIVAYAFDAGWQRAVGLFAVTWLASFVIGMGLSTGVAMFRRAFESDLDRQLGDRTLVGDWFIFWLLGTFALWPLFLLLAWHVSWFGLLN